MESSVDVVLAIDIGGTKVAAGVVTLEGDVLLAERAPTDGSDPWPGLEALVRSVLVQATAEGLAAVAAGVGCGGPMLPGGETVSPLNIPGWRGFPLRDRLAALTGLPVWVDNDAKALALGEGWVGAAAGERDYLAMVVSTGVGGGIVLDGRLLHGASGNGGHIGHIIVVEDGGRRCACGSIGCLEAEASGLSIEAMTGQPRPRHRWPSGSAPVSWSAGPWLPWRCCSTCGSRWSPVRSPWASVRRSSTRHKPSSTAAVASSTPRRGHQARRAGRPGAARRGGRAGLAGPRPPHA